MALTVMGKEISHIGDSNGLRGLNEPKAAIGATAGLDKPGPRHQLEDLGSLRRREAGG